MSDIEIRRKGRAGRITLARPAALNALTYDMALGIEAALEAWSGDDDVALVVIDAEGDKAFCAGGDLGAMYESATQGDFEYGRRFWRDEYRLNAKIARYPKPFVALMQGFVMGGGVGISCHGSHRVVCETTRIAMPECAVGLVPDVGGSWLLARAPGRLGEYLGMTGARMGPAEAIEAGFADHFIPREAWAELVAELVETGEVEPVIRRAIPAGESRFTAAAARISEVFALRTAADIEAALDGDELGDAVAGLRRGCPLSVACTLELVRQVRRLDGIEAALAMEYRFTARSAEQGDFIEGIRAAIIDKDRRPAWRHKSLADVSAAEVAA
ncbi:MAG: enoyl-CoA hydratase/isomerase family protein, partial [Pseudomonadota bacterium]